MTRMKIAEEARVTRLQDVYRDDMIVDRNLMGRMR
jgi:hypothetical protein